MPIFTRGPHFSAFLGTNVVNSQVERARPVAPMSALAARHDRLAAPIAGVDIPQRLRQHPCVAKRVDESGLAFSVRPVACGVCVDAGSTGGLEHRVDVVNSKHPLMGSPRHTLSIAKFAHDHLGTLTLHAELYAMGLAHADVFDEPEHGDIPGDSFADVGHSKNRNDTRLWR